MLRLIAWWPRLGYSKGQILPPAALAMVGLIGVSGMATDLGYFYYEQQVQQNAAEAAASAAVRYWVSHPNASDLTLLCIVELYASSSLYQSYLTGPLSGCPPSQNVPDNGGNVVLPDQAVKGQTGAWYVDGNGNDLVPVGSLGASYEPLYALPGVVGIRVYSVTKSPAFFSRIFGVKYFVARGKAAYRMEDLAGVLSNPQAGYALMGSFPLPSCSYNGEVCTSVGPASSNPSTWQNGMYLFPAVFYLSVYNAAPHYSVYNPPSSIPSWSLNIPANQNASFNWSRLQCLGSEGNNVTMAWLALQNPCPGMPDIIGSLGSQICSLPNVTCAVNVDPGVREVDASMLSNFIGKVVLVPLVSRFSFSAPVEGFAYFYIAGASGSGAHISLNGFFIDPQSLPSPGGIGGSVCTFQDTCTAVQF